MRDRVFSIINRVAEPGLGAADVAAALDDAPELVRCADVEYLARPTPPPLNAADQKARDQAASDIRRASELRDQGDITGADALLDTSTVTAAKVNDHELATRAWLLRIEIARDRGDMTTAQVHATQAAAEAGLSGDTTLVLRAQLAMLVVAAGNNPSSVDGFTSLEDMPDTLDTATLRMGYADALMAAGRFKDGESEYRRVLATRERLLPPAHLDRELAKQRLGAALVIQKRVDEARPLLEESGAAVATAMPPLRREAIESLRYLAMVAEEQGNVQKALELHREIATRRAKALGPTHAMTLEARADVGRGLSDLEHYTEAATELEAVVAGMQAGLSERSVNLAEARLSLANVYISLGRFADADATLDLAVPIIRRARGAESPYTIVAEFAQARSWVERSTPIKLDAAIQILDRAGATFVKLFGESSQPAAAVAITRARALLARGDVAGADEQAARAVAMLGDDKRAERAEALAVHAAIRWRLGDKQGARDTAARSLSDFEAFGTADVSRVDAVRHWMAAPSPRPPLPPASASSRAH
jgi:tetratricopeptide (TPR) repeat protein